jgi:hypothetical protein
VTIHLTKVSQRGLGENVSHVEACQHMMYLDVSFLQVVFLISAGAI